MEINSFFSLNDKALCPLNTVSQPYVEAIRYLTAMLPENSLLGASYQF